MNKTTIDLPFSPDDVRRGLLNEREKGPIEILCKEIDFPFDRRLEHPSILVAFVAVLVSSIASMRYTQEKVAEMTGGKMPSADSEAVLGRVLEMLASTDYDLLTGKAAEVHTFIHSVYSDEAYPCDHLIDMLSSCVSAIRFGLEKPCHSRHAAAACSDVWKQVYNIRQFDRYTPKWEHDWARAQLQEAIMLRMQPVT